MHNVLNFTVCKNVLWGVEGDTLWLGAVAVHVREFGEAAAVTEALRDFNVPNARHPADWPARETAHVDICNCPEFASVRNF